MAGYDNPEYRAYQTDVKDGKVTLPLWDETETITILPGELYCRVAFCGHTNTPSSSTNNLRKHVQRAHPHLTLVPGKNGKVPNNDIMAANRFYSSLYSKTDDDQDSSTEPSDASTPEPSSPPPPARKAPTRKAPTRKAPTRKPPAHLPSPEGLQPMPMKDGKIDAAAVRKVGIRKSGKRAPCSKCRNNGTTCGSTNVCDFWEYFESPEESEDAEEDADV
ncbi:uncharacterized protein ASPGLDRAFT_40830 [Aspergillus glaucus CBS 516.65]|uniref:Uncharacterized protein n=1 Tax=Aspergillus glaucus CBS 516.65 TaxID=1160497 RepID=A0A1L9V3B6_ASPGL|nr:hypothetical protein ASPGLDRAFT_40830 [Aspergillus glaucus CBS 516.65]OJJ78406.1 hypothetical protein ASPGLDRAFT_40830 [Aspergillus glaucus CBS 516.65]